MKINLNNLKSQSGITLSSLIVTIIVMMILSVASVSILSGNTGILDETEFAVNGANKQVIIDEVKIMVSKFGVMWGGNETLRDYVVNKLQSYEDGYETETGGKINVSENGYVTYIDKNGRKIVFEEEDGQRTILQLDKDGNVSEVAYVPDI